MIGFAVVLFCVPLSSPAEDLSRGPVEAANDKPPGLEEVMEQLREMKSVMLDLRARVEQLQSATEALRGELKASHVAAAHRDRGGPAMGDEGGPQPVEPAAAPGVASSSSTALTQAAQPPEQLEEDVHLLEAKVNEHYQTKVESASKYRVRLSGIALLNMFSNRGTVDNMDVPGLAISRNAISTNGSFGATVRQTMLGLEVFGPSLAGARTRGAVQMDFFGGIPDQPNGAALGVMRVRTATFEMNWSNTSVIAGLDAPFISPLSPSSIATLAEPAFSYSGNLWTWIPQIRIEHRLPVSDTSSVRLQAGILDPLSGEPPYYGNYRYPHAGEKSGQPAYAARFAWTSRAAGNPLAIGVGGFYSRQNWGMSRDIDSWATTLDWNIPLASTVSLSGEFYRGRAAGGLGGGIGRSVVYSGSLFDPATRVLGLNSVGGWGQLQYRPTQNLEFNGAFGQDNPFAEDLRRFYPSQSYYDAELARNRTSLTNVIYHPKSNLVLSLEYRRLWTYDIDGASRKANHVNLGIGVLF